MKKTVLFIVLIAASSIATQVKAQVEVSIGVKGGLNLSNFELSSPNPLVNASVNLSPSFHGGGFVLFKLSKIGIQPEVIFSRQGSAINIRVPNVPTTQETQSNFDYINIPIICKIYLLAGLNIQVGPQVGFCVGAKQKALSDPNIFQFEEQDVTDLVKVADVGIAVGLGWDLPFGLVIDARYNFGLTNINDNPATRDEVSKNRVIQVSLGYKIFKIGGKK